MTRSLHGMLRCLLFMLSAPLLLLAIIQPAEADRESCRLGALSACDKLLEANPRDAHAYLGRAAHFAIVADLERVIAEATKALEIDPDLVNALTTRGAAMLVRGNARDVRQLRAEAKADFEAAVTDYRRAAKLRPNEAIYSLLVVEPLVKAGRPAEALAFADSYFKTGPVTAAAHFLRGTAHEAMGQREAAIADYRAALRLDRFYDLASFRLGRLGAEP